MQISRNEYLSRLRKHVSDEEREDLENGDILFVSWYNRETMLRMLHSEALFDGTVDTDQAEALTNALLAYLNKHMPDYPQGHKWIILACLFLSMVVREPMHQQRTTGWQKHGDQYYCRAREDQEGSVCRWCVCHSYHTARPDL